MGKRIIQQARGKGSFTYRVRPKAYIYKISYPALSYNGPAKIIKLFHSSAHSAPLLKIEIDDKKTSKFTGENENKKTSGLASFFIPSANGVYEGQEIYIGKRPDNKEPKDGDILNLKDIKQGTKVFNIETVPGNGGKVLRSAGCSGLIGVREGEKIELLIRKRNLKLNENCRAVVGVIAGDGRKSKPLVKAGKQFYRMKAIGRKWHRTSAVKMNVIDHPFGGGRGKRIKSKIAKRNAPAGARVGHVRPSRTGRGK